MNRTTKKIVSTILCAAMLALLAGCSSRTSGKGSSTESTSNQGTSSQESSADSSSTSFGENKVDIRGNLDEVKLNSGDLIAEITVKDYGTIKAKLFPEAAPVGVENFQKLANSGYYKGLKIHRVMQDFMIQGGSLNGNGTGGDAAVNGGSFGIETNRNLRHFYGALCYANAAGSNTTQFYIVNKNTPATDGDFDTSGYDDAIEQYKAYAQQAAAEGNTAYWDYFSFQAKYCETTKDWLENASDEVKNLYKERGGTPFLDGNYTVFGQVYEGLDVIDSISSAEVQNNGNDEISLPVQDIIITDIKVYSYSE